MSSIINSELWTIGIFVDTETLVIEYKEFRFFKGLFGLSNEDMIKFVFNKSITNLIKPILNMSTIVLQAYINLYVPKYMVTFGNTPQIKNGLLYIGIADSGEITGVPLSQELLADNSKIISTWIIKKANETLCDHFANLCNIIVDNTDAKNYKSKHSETVIKYLLDRIEIKIIRLSSDFDLIDDNIDEIVNELKKEKKKYDCIDNKYIYEKKKWNVQIVKYKSALNKIINQKNIRDELINYINNDNKTTTLDSIRTSMLARLSDKKKILFVKGQVVREKYIPNKIAYWITNFRDYKINGLIKIKPKYHNLTRPQPIYIEIIKKYRPLLKKMIKNGIKFGVIKISFPGKEIIDNCDDNIEMLSYIDKTKRKYAYRTLDSKGSPVTQEFDNNKY
jgi:hypothetical protein